MHHRRRHFVAVVIGAEQRIVQLRQKIIDRKPVFGYCSQVFRLVAGVKRTGGIGRALVFKMVEAGQVLVTRGIDIIGALGLQGIGQGLGCTANGSCFACRRFQPAGAFAPVEPGDINRLQAAACFVEENAVTAIDQQHFSQ